MTISNLTCENNVILLGINIDCMLIFDDYVADICKEVAKTISRIEKTWQIFNQTR